MRSSSHPLLISLKPIYADLVFQGSKTVELRRKASQHISNRDIYIYVSSPVMELRGGFQVGKVWVNSPEKIWNIVSKFAGIDRDTFDNYYRGKSIAYALEIKGVWEYQSPLSLKNLRSKFNGFVAPQSYRFLTDKEMNSIPRLKKSNFLEIAYQ